MGFLDRVIEYTRLRVEVECGSYTQATSKSSTPKHSLVAAISDSSFAPLIGEVKPASPSAGWVCMGIDAGEIALKMVQAGAVGVSVLTEPVFFHGSIENLIKVREMVEVPVLMKDFIIDERQILRASQLGADSILLIPEICPDISKLYKLALTLGVEPLLEVHCEEDLDRIAPLNPRLVGVNNRNLDTLKVDLKKTQRLAPLIRRRCPEALVVSESGVETADDVRFLLSCGADAVLVGSSLMRAKDVVAKVEELVGALKLGKG
ncbi:MAG: indole-3-glycerol-phosphate synthase [Candidatus Bathyarchaeia archaeon]